jgi:hypothetical protein
LFFTFLYAGSSIQNASEQLFCKLRSSSNPTNKNLTELGLETLVAKEWDHSGRSIEQENFI